LVNISHCKTNGITEELLNISFVGTILLPVAAIPSTLAVDHDIAHSKQDSSEEDTEEALVSLVVDCGNSLAKGSQALSYFGIKDPPASRSRLHHRRRGRGRKNKSGAFSIPHGHAQDPAQVSNHGICIVGRQFCFNEVGQKRIHLRCDGVNP